MARSRILKPEFWSDEKLALVPREARLTFAGLWTCSDDYGVTKGHPAWLKAQIFPYDIDLTVADFQKWLIPMLKERNVRKGFIEQEAYISLRGALPEYLKPVLTFAYLSGWRRSEILGLTWHQVNLGDGIVRLEPGDSKNDEGRTL